MKIRKFNESVRSHVILRTVLKESKYIALYFYDVAGYIDDVIIFENKKDLSNYILNFVNNFIIEIYDDTDIDSTYIFKNVQKKYVIHDKDDYVAFIDSDEAEEWYNEFNEDSGRSMGHMQCKEAKDIELEDRVKIVIDTNKYNL